jgi:DNA polymerase III delta prime subunit
MMVIKKSPIAPKKASRGVATPQNKISGIIKQLDNTYNSSEDPLLLNNNSCVYLISGRRGSGKSTLALCLLNSKLAYRKRFKNIFLISPTAKSDKKFEKLVDELNDDNKYFQELNESNIESILDVIKSDNEENDKKNLHMILLDDVVLDLPKRKSSLLNKLVIESRHHNVTLLILSQKYNAIPTIIRANMDLISFFPSLNAREVATFQEDLNISKELFYKMYDKATKSNNSFLHVNLLNFPPIFYHKFDKINVNGEMESEDYDDEYISK